MNVGYLISLSLSLSLFSFFLFVCTFKPTERTTFENIEMKFVPQNSRVSLLARWKPDVLFPFHLEKFNILTAIDFHYSFLPFIYFISFVTFVLSLSLSLPPFLLFMLYIYIITFHFSLFLPFLVIFLILLRSLFFSTLIFNI